MSLIDLLCEERAWLDFLAYKKERHIPLWREKELSEFIEKKEYMEVCREIERGSSFLIVFFLQYGRGLLLDPLKRVIGGLCAAPRHFAYLIIGFAIQKQR